MRRPQLILIGLAVMSLIVFGVLVRSSPPRVGDLAPTDAVIPGEPQAETARIDDPSEAPAPTKTESSLPSIEEEYQDAHSTYTVHGLLRLVGTSEPLPNFKVRLTYSRHVSARARELPPGARGFPPACANTDLEGKYSIAVPRHACLDAISVTHMDGDSLQQSEQQIPLQKTLVDLKLRELWDDLELHVWARRAPTLSGTVVDADTLAPIKDATLLILGTSFMVGANRPSDALGRFEVSEEAFAFRELGGLSIKAQHPDYSSVHVPVPDPSPDGTFAQLTVALAHGVVVKGIVLGPRDTPLPGVRLALRPLVGSGDSDLHEITANVETTSGEDGGFALPAVRKFDRAWLMVPVQPRDEFAWYGERRILLNSSNLEDLRVHVELQTSVEVTATFPDGTIANRNELLLACAEADGSAWVAAPGTWLACPVDRPVRVFARGWKRALKARSPRYVGEEIRSFELGTQSVARIQIALAVDSGYVPVDAELGPMEGATALPSWVLPALHMTVRDPATGPLDRAHLNVDGGVGSLWSVDGLLEVRLHPGWSVIEVGSGGHRSRWFEIFVGDQEPAPLMLDLEPLR